MSADEDVRDVLLHDDMTLAVAESLTGGLLSDQFAKLPRASKFFRGGIVAYSGEVKRDLLGIGDAPVVSRDAAVAMAEGVARLLGADVGVSVTGVGGPGPEDGVPQGTVWMAVHTASGTEATLHHFDGDPAGVVEQSCAAAIAAVRAVVC